METGDLNKKTSLALRILFCSIALILLVVIEAISFRLDGYQVMGNTLHDYDTLTRIAYLRGALQQHMLAHGYFARMNAPYGMVLHWTLPFNLIVLAIIKIFALVNPNTAVQYAGYWTGTILRLFVGPAAYWAGRSILTPLASVVASVLIAFSPYLLSYGHRGTANYHALMFLEAVLLAGFAFRVVGRPRSNAYLPLALGVMAALCFWTTVEMVILIGPLFATLFYLYIPEGEARLRQLLLTSASFSITMSLGLLVDQPYGGIGAPVLDHISLGLQTLASIPFALALGAWWLMPANEYRRARYVCLSGAIAALIWIACFPYAVHGINGMMDPYIVKEWFNQIQEVMPLYQWRNMLLFLGPGLLGAFFVFAWRQPRDRKEAVLIALGALFILGQLHFRFALYVAVAAPFFLAYGFERMQRNNGEFPAHYAHFAAPAAIAVMTLYVGAQLAMLVFHYDVLREPGADDGIPDAVTCDPWLVRKPLSDVAWMGVGRKDPIVIDEMNYAATLLYWTDVRVLAGNYHRDPKGIRDDYDFFRDMEDNVAKDIVKKRGADFVLLCGNANNITLSFMSVAMAMKEMSKLGDEFDPQETMYTRLTDGEPPPWLKLRPWPDTIDTDLLLYQVDKSKLGP